MAYSPNNQKFNYTQSEDLFFPQAVGNFFWLWGDNQYGQIGDGTIVDKSSPVQTLITGNVWATCSLGTTHAGGILTDTTMWLWGRNNLGQIGDSTTLNKSSPTQIAGSWSSISCGYQVTAGIKGDGTLWLWGQNADGQLANNTTNPSSSPTQSIDGSSNWQSVSLGYNHGAGVKTDGSLWLWGSNYYGQLGNNSLIYASSPIQTIIGGTDWQIVSSGDNFTIAIKKDGSIWSWGYNNSGQLGTSNFINYSSPVQIDTGVAVWVGAYAGNAFTVAFGNTASLLTPTPSASPTLSPSPTPSESPSPTPSESPSPTPSESASATPSPTESASPTPTPSESASPTPTPTESGSATPTPSESASPTPTPSESASPTPTPTESGSATPTPTESASPTPTSTESPTPSASGATPTPTPTTTEFPGRYLYLWGGNTFGQLAQGNVVDSSNPLQIMSNTSFWTQASAGSSSAAAIKVDGSLWVWGSNTGGQLGNENIIATSSPIQSSQLTGYWMSVSMGQRNIGGIVRIQPTPTITPSPSGTQPTPTYTSTPTETPSPTASPTPTGSPSPTPSPTLSASPTPSPSPSGSLSPTPTLSASPTPSPTSSVTASPTPTSSTTPSPTPSGTQPTPTPTNTTTPSPTPSATPIAGQFKMYGWGYTLMGQVGGNYGGLYSVQDPIVIGDNDWVKLGTLSGIKQDGTLWTWGPTAYQFVKECVNFSSPVQYGQTATDWSECDLLSGIKKDGTLWFWGYLDMYYINDGGYSKFYSSTPVQVFGNGSGWTSLGRSFQSILAYKGSSASRWGSNYLFDLGLPNNLSADNTYSSPVYFAGSNWKDGATISGSKTARFLIDNTGKLYTWGAKGKGLTGDAVINYFGDDACVSAPAQIFADKQWSKVSCGYYHAVGICTDGTLWSWGWNYFGALGNGIATAKNTLANPNPVWPQTSSPVQEYYGSTDWADVEAGGLFTMATKKDGTIWTWGNNTAYEIGLGNNIDTIACVPIKPSGIKVANFAVSAEIGSNFAPSKNTCHVLTQETWPASTLLGSSCQVGISSNLFAITYNQGPVGLLASNLAGNNANLPNATITINCDGNYGISVLPNPSYVNINYAANYFRITITKNGNNLVIPINTPGFENYVSLWQLSSGDQIKFEFLASTITNYIANAINFIVKGFTSI